MGMIGQLPVGQSVLELSLSQLMSFAYYVGLLLPFPTNYLY